MRTLLVVALVALFLLSLLIDGAWFDARSSAARVIAPQRPWLAYRRELWRGESRGWAR